MPLEASLTEGDSSETSTFRPHRLWEAQETRLLLAILIGGALLYLESEAFFTFRNLRSVLMGVSFIGIATLGQFLVILTGRIDLSSGSLMGLAGMITAIALSHGVYLPIAVAMGIGVGALAGLINAVLSVSLNLNSFIVTLGTLQVARGIAIALAEGKTISGFPDGFLSLASPFFGLSLPVWTLIILAAITAFVIRYTVIGRELPAIGGNEAAARLAGVNVDWLLKLSFILSGAAAGLAGVLMTARLGAALGNAATGYELTVIASAVIGGARLAGGVGSVMGVLLGAVLIALVNNALVLLAVPTYWQQTFIGSVIIIAALVDRIRR